MGRIFQMMLSWLGTQIYPVRDLWPCSILNSNVQSFLAQINEVGPTLGWWVMHCHFSWEEGTLPIAKPLCASFLLTCLLTKVEWCYSCCCVHQSNAQYTNEEASGQSNEKTEIQILVNCFLKHSMWFVQFNLYKIHLLALFP